MKQLVILRGAMCSGKSTWVHENELEEYTLSPDHIRVLSGAMGKRDINGHYTAEVKADRPVFKIIMDMLEQRMKKGQFTVIDATHGTERSINAYRELCKKYGYRAYVVDFRVDADTLKSRLEERNRESHGSLENNKYIPEYALDYKIKQLESHKIPSWVTVLSPDNAIQKLSWQFKELGNRTLYAFGDIHSSYRVLKEAWDKLGLENNKEDLIVFCGDYFDRGRS
jgi:predicted kinase